MKIGNREFDTKHHTYVMGILNVTPDSFSDGGNYDQIDAALFHVEQMKKDGADLIDVGGLRALAVEILDAQHHAAALGLRHEP